MADLRVVGKRRRYNAKTKAQAAGIAAAEGVTEAERQTGIPKETIHYWLRQPQFAPLRTTAQAIVVEDFWAGVQIGIEEVTKALRNPDVPLRDKAQALGVIYDRFALLSGRATGRTEARDITDTLSPDMSEALADDIDEWLRARADA